MAIRNIFDDCEPKAGTACFTRAAIVHPIKSLRQPRKVYGFDTNTGVPDNERRRSVYALRLRGHRDPFMETFNQPGSEKSCEFRDSSTITPQALTLLNSDETSDRALAFANRVLSETETDQAAVQRVFQLAYGRAPELTELSEALAYWRQMSDIQSKIEYQPPELPTMVIRQAVDENTGKPFKFTERLFVYDDYVPDLGPHQVDAHTRGFV